MKKPLLIHVFQITFLFALMTGGNLSAQTIDSTFRSPLPLRAAEIYEIKELPDGKIILAGDINYFEYKKAGRLIRLNQDGTFDNTFRTDLPPDFVPQKMELMNSGHILVYDYYRLFKLGPNGRVKATIVIPGLSSVTVLPNDKFLACSWSGGLYRYKANLEIDSTFPNLDNFADGPILDVSLQDNKYVICGSFTTVNGVSKNDVARLHPNGTVDSTFDAGSGTDDFVMSSLVDPNDGSIYLAGSIYSFNGVYGLSGIVRLSRNGLFDNVFLPNFQGAVTRVFFATDQKIVLSGYNGIAQFNHDGTPDINFNRIEDVPYSAPVVEQLADGTLLAGLLKTKGGDYGIAKFDSTGTELSEFHPPVSRLGTITSVDKVNRKLIVTGDFFLLNKHHTYNLGRLHANGSADTTFQLMQNFGSGFQCAVLPDKKVVASFFNDVVRLNPNGQVDESFQYSPFKKLYQVTSFRVQSDGKIIAAGPNGVYRLNSDGSEDPTYDEGTGTCCIVLSEFGMDVQSSGKVIYGSLFSEFNGIPVNKMVRLNHDATVDTTFNIGSGPDNGVLKIEALSNDELIVAGWFSSFDGNSSSPAMVKLSPDGVLDTTFNAGFTQSTSFFDIKEFGNHILVAAYQGDYVVIALDHNGSTSTDFVLPAEIESIRNISRLYSPNDNTLFILGNLTIQGRNRPSVLTKILYNPTEESSAQLLSASIAENSLDSEVKFSVFPNPSQREIIFDVNRAYDMRVVKLSGEVVLEEQVSPDNKSVDISRLVPDTYVIQLISGNKRQTSILVKD